MRKRFFVCNTQPVADPCWQPAADIYRIRDGWLIKVDLAGISLQDVEVTQKGNCLTIQGLRRDVVEEETANYHSLEISYNRFKRAFQLPVSLDDASVKLSYRDGMLMIRIEKEVR